MKLVEQKRVASGADAFIESDSNAPSNETRNARLETIGPFRIDNVAIDTAATAMTLGATDAGAPVDYVAPVAGTIVGLIVRSNADLTAGSVTVQATVGGTVKGTTAVLSDLVQTKIVNFTTPVPFVAGDFLGAKLLSDHTLAPVTADFQAMLLVRWEPS